MKKLILFFLVSLVAQSLLSQEVCEGKNVVQDANDISSITKCSVNGNLSSTDKEKSKVKVVSSRSRQKRRSIEIKNDQKNTASNRKKINDSVKHLQLDHIKENIIAVNTVIEEKLVKEQVCFNEVEFIPQFRDCSDESLDPYDCFNHEMEKHLVNNISYPEKALKNNIQGDVWVSFIITHSGEVKNILATGGDESSEMLTKEAIRVISILPSFIPGKQNNQEVSVRYTFPISFNLD